MLKFNKKESDSSKSLLNPFSDITATGFPFPTTTTKSFSNLHDAKISVNPEKIMKKIQQIDQERMQCSSYLNMQKKSFYLIKKHEYVLVESFILFYILIWSVTT